MGWALWSVLNLKRVVLKRPLITLKSYNINDFNLLVSLLSLFDYLPCRIIFFGWFPVEIEAIESQIWAEFDNSFWGRAEFPFGY